jgi:hypothetical protein
MRVTGQDLQIEFSAEESPDWGYARNLRAILKRPFAEWSSSISSTSLSIKTPYGTSGYIVPNRDFPYEGLFGIVYRENWKFLDSLPIGIYFENEWINIRPNHVMVAPWKCCYEYIFNINDSEGKLQVEYYLLSALRKCALKIGVSIDLQSIHQGHGFLVMDPFIDIRHMYGPSNPEEHEVSLREHAESFPVLQVCKDKKYLSLWLDSDRAFFTPCERILPWSYKLGNGERGDSPDGIRFLSEERLLFAPATISTSIESGRKEKISAFAGWSDHEVTNDQLDSVLKNSVSDEYDELQNIGHVLGSFNIDTLDPGLDKAIAARIISLTKFCITLQDPKTNEYAIFPESGAWWFRAVWLRDVYEGLLNNIHTLLQIAGGKEFMRRIITSSIALVDSKLGGLPNKIPEFEKGYEISEHHTRICAPYYNSSDATLLFVIFACQFVHETKDPLLGVEILSNARKIINSYMTGDQDEINGRPVLSRDNGLLLTVPNHSWADSCIDVRVNDTLVPRFPLRVPMDWVYSESDPHEIYKQVHSPKYFLPEINALWIQALESLIQLLRNDLPEFISEEDRRHCSEEFELLLTGARSAFKKVFWNEAKGFLYNIVTGDLKKKDETETSFAVVSASLLNDLFSDDELKRVWTVTRNTLLVLRKPQIFGSKEMKAFGVLVKNSSSRIFYNDRQYHEAVSWPRDTPYLIRLLERLGDVNTVKEILVNNVDHQMTEGAIFFNNELFGLPEGKNPYPSSTSSNPIPLKNPAQWWSHWTDLFLAFFRK